MAASVAISSMQKSVSDGRSGSLQDLVFERYPFGVIFLEPFFRGVDIRKHFDMVGVADLFACIHVNEDGFHLTIL
jgi:hypothetical protein